MDNCSLDTITYVVDDSMSSWVSIRLDKVLSELMDGMSRSYIQKLIDDEYIMINDKKTKPGYKLRVTDKIDITIPEPELLEVIPVDIPIDIVYEDNDIIIVNKPKGMVVHPAPGHMNDTLVNALMYHCKNLSSINGVTRPGIVHRIDKDTSGLLLVCKNDQAHRIMSERFKIHDINRVYTAICHNRFKVKEGTIDKAIARDKVNRKKMAIDEISGRRAVTHYTVLEDLKNNLSLIECRLETGRTHQIRVHMASINHSLLGDTVYGSNKQPYNTDGQVLHAGLLGFNHPITGEYMEFTSEIPDYFQKLLNILKQ